MLLMAYDSPVSLWWPSLTVEKAPRPSCTDSSEYLVRKEAVTDYQDADILEETLTHLLVEYVDIFERLPIVMVHHLVTGVLLFCLRLDKTKKERERYR
jgi:hypothetical protein